MSSEKRPMTGLNLSSDQERQASAYDGSISHSTGAPPMSSETIPEWAYAQAIEFVANLTDSLVQPEQVEPIALALLAAEQRGLERAAMVANNLPIGDLLQTNETDLYRLWKYAGSAHAGAIAAAILSLGEKI